MKLNGDFNKFFSYCFHSFDTGSLTYTTHLIGGHPISGVPRNCESFAKIDRLFIIKLEHGTWSEEASAIGKRD